MARLDFGSWVWNYHAAQSDEIKAHLEKEIIGGDWLFRQDAKIQLQVLEGAPKDFVSKIMGKLKPEVVIALGYNPFARR